MASKLTSRQLPGGYQIGNPAAIARKYPPRGAQIPPAAPVIPARPVSPLLAQKPAAPLPTGAAGDMGATGPGGQSILNTAPMAQSPGTPPPQGNAAQRWSATEDARKEWMDAGGSERTLNAANVARGLRSKIDARSNPSARNSTASADIRNQWGWGKDPALPY